MDDLFDATYVIVMDNRVPKVEAFFRSLDFRPTFFRAISKYDMTRDDFLALGFVDPEYRDKLNMGRICCHFSHCQVLRRFLADPDARSCLIFEDDNFPLSRSDAETAKYRMSMIMKNIPSDWEFVNFSRCWDYCETNKSVTKDMVQTYRALCRNAYAVSRNGAEKILAHTIPMRRNPGDVSIMQLTRKEGVMLKAYASTENIFAQNRETLSSELENKSKILSCAPPSHGSRRRRL